MNFKVEREVLNLGLKVIGISITDLDNKIKTKDFLKFKDKAYKALKEKYNNFEIETDLILRGFNELHKKIGVKRKKNTPISESLLKNFLKDEILPPSNKLIELCNIVILDSRLSIAIYDMDKIDGLVTLKQASTNISYNFSEKRTINQGEYIYTDSKDILYRLEVNQNPKTIVNEDTTNIFVTVEGNEATSAEYIMEVASEIIDLITTYCGGNAKIIYK